MRILILVAALAVAPAAATPTSSEQEFAPLRGANNPYIHRPKADEFAVEATVDVIDLNTATIDQLQTLPGIGPKKAEAIIALRTRKPFVRVTQLLSVKGIGPRTLQKLKPRLQVAPPAPPAG